MNHITSGNYTAFKKTAVVFVTALSTIFLSCQTTPTSLKEVQPLAIISVVGNSGVPWDTTDTPSSSNSYSTQQTDEGVLTGLVNRAVDRNNPEIKEVQSRIDYASELFSQKLNEKGIKIIDPTTVKNSQVYKNTGKDFMDYMNSIVPARGYDARTNSSSKLNKMACTELGAASVAYVSFRFEKEKVKNGVHEIGVRARVELKIYSSDSNGKTLLSNTYVAKSADYAPLRNSSYDKELLCSFFPEVTENAIDLFMFDAIYSGADSSDSNYSSDKKVTGSAGRVKSAGETSAESSESSENTEAIQTGDGTSVKEGASSQEQVTIAVPAPLLAKRLLLSGMSVEETASMLEMSVEEVQKISDSLQ